MRIYFLAFALAGFAVGVFVACGGSEANPPPPPSTDDGSTDAVLETGDVVQPVTDAVTTSCMLSGGNDPVGLCIQKLVLGGQHSNAFRGTDAGSTGVAASWDYLTLKPDTDDAGAVAHDFHDDFSYAASIADYHSSSDMYGDNELTPTLDNDLTEMTSLLESELATLPNEYSGELYAHIRSAAVGLRFLNDTTNAQKLDPLADAYGRAIYASHYFMVTPVDAGAGDGGGDAAGDGGTDAGPAEGGVTGPDGVIGDNLGGGQVAYAPADVATGALALLDMAVRYPADNNAANWQLAARTSLDHILNRGREPTTGMYYRSLTTSGDPTSDTPTGPAPADVLLADVQATVALTLIRAQDLVNTNTQPVDAGLGADGAVVDAGTTGALVLVADYPFEANADSAIANTNGSHSLWDGPNLMAGNGYFEGYVPSTSTTINTKATRANAFMLAALHRANIVNANPYGVQINSLRNLLLQNALNMGTPNSNLITVVPEQDGYFRSATASFQLITAGEPHPGSYTSAAIGAAVEGLTEQLWGYP
jgi:hypothetical protein